ncbi:hypothetical protein R8Z50_25010 [Longispora sp. K20-0274]|uniref:hypothetical protein n=1 Tax=Longispora sp. K20-0274 TaxID=3088255 RepID=UPI0039995FE5
MDVRKLLDEVGSTPAPPSRLVAAEVYAAGRRTARRRLGPRALLAGLLAAVAVGGAGATAYALSGGFTPDPAAPEPTVAAPWSSVPETSAPPTGHPTTPAPTRPAPSRSASAPLWDCAAAGAAATAVLAQQAGGTDTSVTCADGTLRVVATIGRSGPTKVTMTVRVSRGAAGSVCVTGQSVRCEDTALGPLGVWGAAMSEVRLGRADGTIFAVSTQVEGLWSGPAPMSSPEQLRGVALALAGRI